MYSPVEVRKAKRDMLIKKLAYLEAEKEFLAMSVVKIKDRFAFVAEVAATFKLTVRELADLDRGLPFERGQHSVTPEAGVYGGGDEGGC